MIFGAEMAGRLAMQPKIPLVIGRLNAAETKILALDKVTVPSEGT